MGTKNPANSPMYLVARSASALRRSMRLNNIKRKAQHSYNIMQAKDGLWYAWFEPYWLSAEEKSESTEGIK